ncbi:MAG: hypothetical protein LBN95_07245 [Prevotellaceae bacterium]|jgi:hypothetical protein|nr:hypothetical protein [Prevotellaceae bacterium]
MYNKILKKVVIIFAAIMIFCPTIKADDVTTTAAQILSDLQEEYKNDSNVVVGDVSIKVTAIAEPVEAAEDYQVDLNFNFSQNKDTFYKALDILGIGFATVFVVMIIFIFVSTGIDKAFPYKEEK